MKYAKNNISIKTTTTRRTYIVDRQDFARDRSIHVRSSLHGLDRAEGVSGGVLCSDGWEVNEHNVAKQATT